MGAHEFRGRAPGGEAPRKLIAYYGYLAGKQCIILCNLAKVHEPLVKHEKNQGCSAGLFAELSSN